MTKLEVIARALCDYEGRVADKEWHDVPQWKRYEAQAQTVINAIRAWEDGKKKKLEVYVGCVDQHEP